jgi:hypothetical protein
MALDKARKTPMRNERPADHDPTATPPLAAIGVTAGFLLIIGLTIRAILLGGLSAGGDRRRCSLAGDAGRAGPAAPAAG